MTVRHVNVDADPARPGCDGPAMARGSRGTDLAQGGEVPRISTVLLLALGFALSARHAVHAESAVAPEPPWSAEVSLGYGAALGGGAGGMVARPSPMVLTLGGAVMIRSEPAVAAHGALVLETLDRSAVGAMGGVRLTGLGGGLRIGVDGIGLVAPYTLWGIALRAGRCVGLRPSMRLCADLGLTTYVAGSDLGPGQTTSQLQLHLGVAFDAA